MMTSKVLRNLIPLVAVSITLMATPLAAQVTETEEHIITKVAEGLLVIRHKRAAEIGAASGNTTVVVGDREVLVVDSCLLPSIAQGDIALIKQWTDKPVRYLVNTHWHGDHTWGNGLYLDTFPGLAIVAHTETARQMGGYLPNFLERNAAGATEIRKILAAGKNESGVPLTDSERDRLQAAIPRAEARAVEYKALLTRLPNLTFEHELNIDLGNRVVQIKHLGRGNTSGDVVVFIPQDKAVVTGDMLVYPFPYLIGGFPAEWSKTLQKLSQLGAQTIIPGHGAVVSGAESEAYLSLLRDLLEGVSAAVRRATFKVGNGAGNLDAVTEAVKGDPDVANLRRRFVARDPALGARFDTGLVYLIMSAYREAWGN